MKPRGCDVRLHMRVRSPCGILRAARQVHAHALLWCGVADSGFCDRGDCEVTLFCSALCHTRAAPYRKGQGDPTSTCHSCRPTTGVWQGDSRALALLTLPGERLLWAAVSCESLPQTHTTQSGYSVVCQPRHSRLGLSLAPSCTVRLHPSNPEVHG